MDPVAGEMAAFAREFATPIQANEVSPPMSATTYANFDQNCKKK